MFGVHRMVIGRRRDEATQPNVANEFAAMWAIVGRRCFFGTPSQTADRFHRIS